MLTPHQKEALNYKKHISLTANAGSGKTFVLSKRFLEIALNENIQLRNIAAITFTDKAAGELYKKIADELNAKLISETDPSAVKKLQAIRRQLVSASISTIHSFCIDILREYPVEAGIDADFMPIDVNLTNDLIELSIEEMIQSIIGRKSAPSDFHAEQKELKNLIRILGSKRNFQDELFGLIQNRKNVLLLASEIYSQSEELIADFFYKVFRSVLKDLLTLNMKDFLQNLLKINKAASDNGGLKNSRIREIADSMHKLYDDDKEGEHVITVLRMIKEAAEIIFTSTKTVRVNYLPREIARDYSSEIQFLKKYFSDFSKIDIPENEKEIEMNLAVFGKSLILFFNKALGIYTGRKKQNGYLDYEDILLHTFMILQNESIREELSEKYKYIMIDEYQDTNELQYSIFLPLLSYLKKNNLFVVGDEKQSIYMFRDAELEVFEKTRNNIRSASGKDALLTLPDSFRMAPALCVFINFLFKNLFSNPNIVYNEVKHTDLICARNDSSQGAVEVILNKKEDDESGDNEAELVGKRILKLAREKKLSFSSMAVLCRKRSFFESLEKAFVKYRVPYSIVGGKGFYQRQSVFDIYNYFSFLLDKNDTALAGILRSPFFSLSDALIYEISLCNGYSFWEKLKNYAGTSKEIAAVAAVLEKNLGLANHLQITPLLRTILTESGYLAVLAAKPNGSQETANIEKLIRVTNTFNEQGFRTLYDYVDFLNLSITELEDEAQAPLPDELNIFPGTVKIMTLHQAKGLEFPAVFLFKCHEIPRNDKVSEKSVTINKNLGLLTKVPLGENYFGEYFSAPVAGLSDLILKKKNYAEVKRLFYVGATRAKDFLFLSGIKEKTYRRDSFFGLLCEGMGIDLSESSYNIDSDLTSLINDGNNYINITRKFSINIPVVNEIPEIIPEEPLQEKEKEIPFIHVKTVEDLPEGEIFSATKITIYKQCPLKYKLTYELRYADIFNRYKEWKMLNLFSKDAGFEFNQKEIEIDNIENKEKLPSAVSALKGKIIHKILQKEITRGNLGSFISNEIEDISATGLELPEKNVFKEEILSFISPFLESQKYASIISYPDYRNEFQVYAAVKDYYLFGIIDKIIFNGSTTFIIDYKTDDISLDEIVTRAKTYLNQLKFYSYIISRLFPHLTEFEMRLIFIKHYDSPVIEKTTRAMIVQSEDEISSIVQEIRMKRFPKNLKHCRECSYSIKGKCILV